MTHEDYIKQLEESNSTLQEKLDIAQNYVDRVHDNPLQESLILMVEACLKQQNDLRRRRIPSLSLSLLDEAGTLRVYLPRQIGLTTCIRKACERFFNDVHVLALPQTVMGKLGSNIHRSVTDIPNKVSCIIVDPWTHLSARRGRDMESIEQKIHHKIDTSKPFLIVLAG
jgi:hypothetical protein